MGLKGKAKIVGGIDTARLILAIINLIYSSSAAVNSQATLWVIFVFYYVFPVISYSNAKKHHFKHEHMSGVICAKGFALLINIFVACSFLYSYIVLTDQGYDTSALLVYFVVFLFWFAIDVWGLSVYTRLRNKQFAKHSHPDNHARLNPG